MYVLSGTVAGAVAGAGAGLLGSVFAESVLAVLGTLFGVGAAALGVAGLVNPGQRPLQRDRETPKEWVERGPLIWPVLNGVALGFGATTRLGFWLWYLIPIGCFLMANPVAGAAIWALYGFTRTAGASGIWLLATIRPNVGTVALLQQQKHAFKITSGILTVVGLLTFFLMGL